LGISHTKNKTNINKADIARKLDRLVDKVKQKGVFVVARNAQGGFDVFDYLKESVILADLPSRDIAERACNHFNRGLRYAWRRELEIKALSSEYHKLNADCSYYMMTIFNSTNTDAVAIAEIRKEAAEGKMSHILKQLSSIV